jgi:hypothetical protein
MYFIDDMAAKPCPHGYFIIACIGPGLWLEVIEIFDFILAPRALDC